jgi:transposase
MNDRELFGLALGLVEPWFVASVSLDVPARELTIGIDFKRGGTFACPECGVVGCKAYDTADRSWRHLDFFQYRTELRARTPRITCSSCGIKPVNVPWARPGSGFTLLFEALMLQLVGQMPVAAVARQVDEHDTRIWRLVQERVNLALSRQEFSAVKHVAMDETSCKRGHNYISLFADIENAKVLFVADGKGGDTVREFAEDLSKHGGDPQKITDVCCDMSAAYISGVADYLPKAVITFDKFHIVKLLGEAVDKTRREERKLNPEFKGQRYTLLRNPETMSDEQLGVAAFLLERRSNLKAVRAFSLRLSFQELYSQPVGLAEAFLKRWCAAAQRSRVPLVVAFVRTVRAHWTGVLRWFTSRVTNGMLEAINGLVQAAKRRARGYRTTDYMKLVVYLIAGKLDLQVTH